MLLILLEITIGIRNHLQEVANLLDGVESFNGSTYSYDNLYAYAMATQLGLPSLGGASDAHVMDRIGKYATKFYDTIRDDIDFIEAIKSKIFILSWEKMEYLKTLITLMKNYYQKKKNNKSWTEITIIPHKLLVYGGGYYLFLLTMGYIFNK